MSRVRNLECCSCGVRTRGEQWWNRDKGRGVCVRCVDSHALRLYLQDYSPEEALYEIEQCYGWRGIHWDVARSDLLDSGI
jgi:hypothetical protein